eukprot:g44193.t1
MLVLLPTDGFLILHAGKEQCLLGKNLTVLVGPCKLTSPSQQWQWTEQRKLRLRQVDPKVDRCLATVNTTRRQFRNLALQECAQAPRWECEDELPGSLGVAHPRMFLKKWGYLAVVTAETKYHDSWLKYELGERGEPVKLSLCSTQ